MKCEKCGSELSEDVKFCPECGAQITANNAEKTDETGAESDELYEKYLKEYESEKARIKRSQKRWMIFAWVGSLVFALLAVIFKYFVDKGDLSLLVVIFSVPCSVFLFIVGIRNRFRKSEADKERLNQLNQAYQNAKMMK